MTDHATEAERFHNEYLRLRTPGRVPQLADVLALANYHATMAVHDAIRGLAPKPVEIDATSVTGPGIRITGGVPVSDAAMEALCGRALRPEAAQDATGDDLLASQAEPGQVDGGKTAEAAGRRVPWSWSPHPGLHLAEADWQEYYNATDTMVSLKARAENAEAERDAILDELLDLTINATAVGVPKLRHFIAAHTPEG